MKNPISFQKSVASTLIFRLSPGGSISMQAEEKPQTPFHFSSSLAGAKCLWSWIWLKSVRELESRWAGLLPAWTSKGVSSLQELTFFSDQNRPALHFSWWVFCALRMQGFCTMTHMIEEFFAHVYLQGRPSHSSNVTHLKLQTQTATFFFFKANFMNFICMLTLNSLLRVIKASANFLSSQLRGK